VTNDLQHQQECFIKMLHYHVATYYRCSYVVNSIHEHFMETEFHLQVLQHQERLKHKNFTVSYHSYPTLLPQNILQLQLHFSCAFYSINNLRFTKNWVSWNGELPLQVPNFKNSTQIWMKLFQLVQFWFGFCNCSNIYNICKSEWHYSNLPR